jgi:hypothetical protein
VLQHTILVLRQIPVWAALAFSGLMGCYGKELTPPFFQEKVGTFLSTHDNWRNNENAIARGKVGL